MNSVYVCTKTARFVHNAHTYTRHFLAYARTRGFCVLHTVSTHTHYVFRVIRARIHLRRSVLNNATTLCVPIGLSFLGVCVRTLCTSGRGLRNHQPPVSMTSQTEAA